jgi:hypothetical protein
MMKRKLQSGAAMLMFVIFFTFSATTLLIALGGSILFDLADYTRLAESKQAYLTTESLLEDVAYRNVHGMSVGTTESLTLGKATAYATTTYNSASDYYQIDVRASLRNVTRKAQAVLTVGAGSAFSYGLQAGNGGITLSNNSDIFGNIYSNGPVVGSGSAEVFGDIISAGALGNVKDITATGTIRSNTIDHITAGIDAYYNVQIGTNAQNPVAGTRYTPATNQPTVPLPISTTTIQEWKDAVIDNGTTITAADPLCSTGTYTIDTSITIGYLRVQCDLDIKKTGAGITVTVNGPVWVEGNLSFTSGPTIQVDASLGRRSVQFIADKPTDRLTSSKVEIRNSTNFNGSGDSRSYVMLLSMNESAKLGGSETAIDLGQSANGDMLAYSGEGLISIGQNIDLREVTGYQISVDNGSSITYESGLANLLFTSGPGGGYTLNDWQQTE